jgi:hypothetical protein
VRRSSHKLLESFLEQYLSIGVTIENDNITKQIKLVLPSPIPLNASYMDTPATCRGVFYGAR